MQLSNYIIVAAIEVYVLLIAISMLLLFYARKQHNLVRRQQEKLQQLIGSLKKLKLPPAQIQVTGNTYKTHINAQLAATRNHFAGLQPPGEITAEQAEDSTLAHKALALRYRFLQTEESAIAKGDGPLKINWQTFEVALQNLLACAPNNVQESELATLRKRVENLEKFKQLFFDMEQQWQDAKRQAATYHTQLSAIASTVDDKDHFMDVLESYHRVYSDIDKNFEYGSLTNSDNDPKITEPKVITVTRIDPRASDEVIKLRNVAADQHRIISQLQRKLEEAVTTEAREVVVNELHHQLQRQVRFVQESETCIQLLEDELAAASEKINKQQLQVEAATTTKLENIRIKETLQSFTQESKELINGILNLEQENETLKSNLHAIQAQGARHSLEPEDESLKKAKAELLTLQGQYAELEEKYLDLRLKG